MSKENTFDIACKIDLQEVSNAINQAIKEIQQRYDLKGTRSEIVQEKDAITVTSEDDFKLKAVIDILQSKLHRRGVPLKALTYGSVEQAAGGTVRQRIALQQGIPIEKAREIVKIIKSSKVRVQVQIQEDQVRVSGKNRDDLQAVLALLKEQDLGIEMQFTNYRTF